MGQRKPYVRKRVILKAIHENERWLFMRTRWPVRLICRRAIRMIANQPFSLSRSGLAHFTICAAVCFVGASSFADSITMGSILPTYAVVSVGSTALLENSGGIGVIQGPVLAGSGSTVNSTIASPNGQITGGIDVSGAASGNLFSNVGPSPPVVRLVPATVGTQAIFDAAQLSGEAKNLAPTQPNFGNLNFGQTLTVHGNGGLNVIDGTSIQIGSHITIEGGPKDIFVFNISSGAFFSNTNTIELKGVNPSQILWNFTSTSPGMAVLSTFNSGTQVPMLFGTFLATNGTNFQLNAMNLTGALIDTNGAIRFAGSPSFPPFVNIKLAPFAPTVIPEPGTWSLLATGVLAMGTMLRRKLSVLSKCRS
jgi:hypothetical protein